MAEKKDDARVASMQRAVSIEFIKNSGGYAVKAIRGQKDPAKGWDPRSNTKQKSDLLLDVLANSDDNLGVHLHGALVDVDIDTDNAVFRQAMETFLPASAHVWGRPSNKRSHRVYLLKAADSFDPGEHLLLKRLSRIPEAEAEIRGGPQTRGEFSLLPGSIHPSGEAYEWDDLARARSTPAVASLDALLRALRLSGALAVLAPYWTEGARNDLTMALSGFLYKAWQITSGLSEEAFALDYDGAQRFLEVLLDITGDDPEDRYARKKTFEKTWQKAEAGIPVTGATRISEITGDGDIVAKLYTLLSDSPDVSVIEAFTSRFVIWQGPGLVIDMEGVEKGAQRPFMTRFQFANSYGHQFITQGDKKRLLADLLFSLKSTDRVAGITFDPGGGRMVDSREGKLINQWCGFTIPPYEHPVTDKMVAPFINYVRDVVADGVEEHYQWVMGWVASIFQEPANKCGTALVLVGVPGLGKSFLGHHFLMPIIGEQHSASTNSVEAITKDFNVAFDNKVFIQGDEATNNKQRTTAARMRALITDKWKLIEPKGVDAFQKPNHTRFLFTSNEEEDAVYLQGGTDDRRYTVLSVSKKRKGQLKEYWHPLVEWAKDPDNLAKVHRWLLGYKYDRAVISTPLVTEAKTVMQQRSWDAFDAWLAAWAARGHPLAEEAHLNWHDAPGPKDAKVIWRSGWPGEINITALTRDYTMFIRQYRRGGADMLNEHQLSQSLKKRGLRPDGAGRMIRIDEWDEKKGKKVDHRVRLYPCPTREQVDAYLLDRYGVVRQPDAVEETLVQIERPRETEEF